MRGARFMDRRPAERPYDLIYLVISLTEGYWCCNGRCRALNATEWHRALRCAFVSRGLSLRREDLRECVQASARTFLPRRKQ